MRITEVSSFIVRIPMEEQAFADSLRVVAALEFAGCVIHTDEGISGTGYTTTLGAGSQAVQDIIDRYYAADLVGEDPLLHQRLWTKLSNSGPRWVGRQGVTQMALAAVDIALWDIKAKTFELPLWKLVGGHKEGQVPAYNTNGGWLNFEIPELIEQMTGFVEEGWTGVKMKVGKPDPREDIRRVAAVREAIGDDIDLMVDVNGKWDLGTALTWARHFDEFNLLWIEEPLRPDDVVGHVRLAEATATPLALGELLYTISAFRDFIERGCIAWVQADVIRMGITGWLQVAELAAAYDLPMVPHAGDLMRVHHHLGAGHPQCPRIECIYHDRVQDAFLDPLVLRGSVVVASESPGASTTFDPDAFARLRIG